MTDFLSYFQKQHEKRRNDAKSKEFIIANIQPHAHQDAIKSLEELLISFFDEEYYCGTNSDVALAGVDPLTHFFTFGYKEGRKPNHVFDPIWYRSSHPEASSELNPLLHYAVQGERDGLRPCPWFDPTWYRQRYNVPQDQSPLVHYLRHRKGPFSPTPEFDAVYYLETYPDVANAKSDPFEHYLNFGYKEGRNPSTEFDTRFYINRYLKGRIERNPLIDYLENRNREGYFPRPPEYEATIPGEVKRWTKPGPSFEDLRPLPRVRPQAKVLAYYLTQFHAIPENDRWWGTGFTEWTNLARGLPRFKDHYQPRIPRDLGFYSLDHVETMRRQVQLAKQAGLYGFVFYYYWFNGKRLLDRPLEQFLAARDIDMPFCLMWANENWTRRWDGLDSEILISQDYSEGDDDWMIAEYARHFADPRYIRVRGRPILMIYRPRLIPNAVTAVARWRRLFERNHGETPILIMAQCFGDFDPRPFGLDGAIEFPPHKVTNTIPQINSEVDLLDHSFSGRVYSYDDVVRFSLDETSPEFPLIKTIVPSWDNDARRQGSGLVLHGSTPAKYEAWLSALIERAKRALFFDEPFICINAFNEWCEGAYIEPDLHFGSAYLNATARAVAGASGDRTRQRRILLVGHDAFPSGAQYLLLHIGRTMQHAFGIEVEFVLLDGGALEAEYAKVAPLSIAQNPESLASKVRGLRERGFNAAIVNTLAAGSATAKLTAAGYHTVQLVHELPRLIAEKQLTGTAHAAISAAHHVVFAATYVRDEVAQALAIEKTKSFVIRPQGSYKQIVLVPEEAAKVRSELGIAAGEHMVLGVGYADIRKGFDLFLQVWRLLQPSNPRVHFCWVGGIDPALQEWMSREISAARQTETFHMVGFRSDVAGFFSASDVFALTSREDPFPTVALEAMSVSVPVIAFDGTGGIPEFLKEVDVGMVVPYCDVPAMALGIRSLLRSGIDARSRERTKTTIESQFAFAPYVRDLLRLAMPTLASVSIAVPNYNYAHCLTDRLNTIFDQTHPVEEVIVLDDASTDNSTDVIVGVAEERQRDVTLVVNESNSGSVFAQWAKAADMAAGEFLWIAEADDLSEPSFLSDLLAMMRDDPAIVLGFCDSRAIDGDGAVVFASYKPYYATVEPGALTCSEVFDGRAFVTRFLAVKNLILNASAVLWRREALLAALDRCGPELAEFRMAGDWRLYLEALTPLGARIAYLAEPLNVHRRHVRSVTHSLKAQQHVDEIDQVQRFARRAFGLSGAIVAAQAAYFDEVSTQLLGTVTAAGESSRYPPFRTRT